MKGFVVLSLPLLTAGLILHAQNVKVLDKDQDSDWGMGPNENRFEIKLATFDMNMGTTYPFEAVNDAADSGISTCTFQSQMRFRGVGIFKGSLSEIPATTADGTAVVGSGKPGYCTARAPGWGRSAQFGDISGKTDGMIIWASNANQQGLPTFNIEVMTKGAKTCENSTEATGDFIEPELQNCKKGVYSGEVSIFPAGGFAKRWVPWSEFKCTWRGEAVDWCPPIESELGHITNIGLATAGMGIRLPDTNNTEFNLRIRHFSARKKMLDDPAIAAAKVEATADEPVAAAPAEQAPPAPQPAQSGTEQAPPAPVPSASNYMPNMAKMAKMWAWPTKSFTR